MIPVRKVHELQNLYRDITHLKALIPVLAIKEDEPEYKTVSLGFIKLGGEPVQRAFRKIPERPTDTLFRKAQMIEAMAQEEKQKLNKAAKELLDKLTGTEPSSDAGHGPNNVQPIRSVSA